MRVCHRFTLICFCLFGLGSAFSQIFPARPPVDLFVGYSYVNADTGASRQSLNGWSTSSSINFRRWLALEGEVSGHYDGADGSSHSFAAGPRFNFRPFFVHALFGDDHRSGASGTSSVLTPTYAYQTLSANMSAGTIDITPAPSSSSGSQDSFLMIFGGGAQWKVAPGWSVRASVDYVGTHQDLGSGSWQNNVRVGGGIVYRLRSNRPQTIARQ